jgi:hypothetical protein
MPYLGTSPSAVAAGTIAASATVGDGTAEDTLIKFDGNALDFRIGIDDGDDTLEIGKGGAHGTTAHMIFDTNGIIRQPLQPCFLSLMAAMNNVAHNSAFTLQFNDEKFDQNADFDTSNYTFTAPVTGRYLIGSWVRIGDIRSIYAYHQAAVVTSNRTYESIIFDENGDNDNKLYGGGGNAVICDMDAADTAYMYFYIGSTGSGNTNTDLGTNSYLSAYLLA